MARQRQTRSFRHNRLENVALPYITNMSVTDVRPHYIAGSHDVMTSVNGTAERRLGTLVDPSSATQFASGEIRRFFTWSKSSTEALLFISVVSSTETKVYKLQEGVDTDWQLIFLVGVAPFEPFDYVVSHGHVYFANGTYSLKYDGTTVTQWGVSGPSSAPTLFPVGGGNVPAFIGHQYCYAYGNSTTGYLSDISPLSTIWTTPLEQVNVVGIGSFQTDEIDEVHVFRTEDGGANLYELSNSPIANPGFAAWNLIDNDTDEDLNFSAPAPLRYVNAPAPAMFQPTLFAGRIWGFSGDSLYRSTLEENNTSVPEECFNISPSTPEAYRMGRDIKGLAVAGDFLLVFCDRGIFKIGGDSLSTFYRSTLSKNLGMHFRQNVADFQGNAVWLDTSNTLRLTDGDTIAKPDLSQPIRPDLVAIDHEHAQVIVHDDGLHSWIMLMDGTNGLVYVFDVDTKQWMPPWTWPGITAMISNALFTNGITLQIARYGRALQVTSAVAYDDDPTAAVITSATKQFFTAELRLSLTPMNADNPTGINDLNYVAVEGNAVQPDDVSILIDEAPASGDYVSLADQVEDPDHRVPGAALIEKWYWNRRTESGQRVSAKLEWEADETAFAVYTIDLVHTPTT